MCIAAFTTSWARIRLYNIIELIHKLGGLIYYSDTDSVIYKLPEGVSLTKQKNLEGFTFYCIGNLLGQLTWEDSITNFAAIGCKAYTYTNEKDTTFMKVKGVNTPGKNMTFDLFIDMIKDKTQIETTMIQFKKGLMSTGKRDKNEVYINTITEKTTNTLDKRIYKEDGSSLPFGYNE